MEAPADLSTTLSTTSSHAPGLFCRNSRIAGYHGVSSRSSSQRQSAVYISSNHTGLPSDPARVRDCRIHGNHQIQRTDRRRRLCKIDEFVHQIHHAFRTFRCRGPHLQTPASHPGQLRQRQKKSRRNRARRVIRVAGIRGPHQPHRRLSGPQSRRPLCSQVDGHRIARGRRNRIDVRAESLRQAHQWTMDIELHAWGERVDHPDIRPPSNRPGAPGGAALRESARHLRRARAKHSAGTEWRRPLPARPKAVSVGPARGSPSHNGRANSRLCGANCGTSHRHSYSRKPSRSRPARNSAIARLKCAAASSGCAAQTRRKLPFGAGQIAAIPANYSEIRPELQISRQARLQRFQAHARLAITALAEECEGALP